MDMKEICPCPKLDCPNRGFCDKCNSRHLHGSFLNCCAFYSILPTLQEAIDASPESHTAKKLTTLVEERLQIEGAGSYKQFFKLNPRVDDLAEKFAVEGPDNVSLLVAGTVETGGSGCMCPSATLLKSLMRHLTIGQDEAFVMDMDAGVENLGRGTTTGMDALLVVAEPGRRSLDILGKIRKLAMDIDVGRVFAVGNKVATPDDEEMIRKWVEKEGIPLLGVVPLDETIKQADRKGVAPIDLDSQSTGMLAIQSIKQRLIEEINA